MRWTRISAVVLTASLALLATACGSSTSPKASNAGGQPGSATTTAPPATTTTVPSATIGTIAMPTAAGTFGTAPPTITVPVGAPPKELESADLITGTGAAAVKGDTVSVQYVLVNYSTEQVLQSSWTSSPFSFTLDASPEMVITGWDRGVLGMKVGGRRELIIPPALAYDSKPPQGVPNEATLIFVIDLLKITPA
jgi:peptidylprolyl isomerase